MIHWWRWLVRLIFIILMMIFERTIGFPVVSFFLVGLYTSRLEKGWRWGLMVITSLVMAALFMSSWLFIWLLVGGNYFWVKHQPKFLASRLIRLMGGSLLSSSILSLVVGSLQLSHLFYGAITLLLCAVWLKRYRFYLK